jgi:integrase
MPIRAVMRHAAEQEWSDVPRFKVPKRTLGRTNFLVPDEARRLVSAAAPHIKPLLIFLLGTGARMAEALELEWRDVDLEGARAIFWRTKTGARRVAALPPSPCPRRCRTGRAGCFSGAAAGTRTANVKGAARSRPPGAVRSGALS